MRVIMIRKFLATVAVIGVLFSLPAFADNGSLFVNLTTDEGHRAEMAMVFSKQMGLHDRQAAASIRLRARAMPANQPWISALLRGSSDRFPILSSA